MTSAALPATTKRSNLTRSLQEEFAGLNVGDDKISTGSSLSHRSDLCSQPLRNDASPLSMQSVVDASASRTDKERIVGVVLFLRLRHPKTTVPVSIDTLKVEIPSLLPKISELLPDVEDGTYATLDRLADCDNELAGKALCWSSLIITVTK